MGRSVLWLSAVLVVACSGTSSPSGTTAKLLLPGEKAGSDDDFFSLPFPNDLLRSGSGLDLSAWPPETPIVQTFLTAVETLDGWGLNAATYARFDGPVGSASLPDPASSMTPAASVYLVNVDTSSADYNSRTPVIATFVADDGKSILGNRLVTRPYPGFGLDEATTYALVVTDRVTDAGGAPVHPAPELAKLLSADGNAAYAPLRAWLASDGSADADAVVTAAVFTTQHTHFILPAIQQGVLGALAPVAVGTDVGSNTSTIWTEYTGTYMAPNFQTGDVPYTNSGGEILVGSDGAAIVQRTEPMRFALTIPNGSNMPATGWPFAIYQHGTGGDYETFIQDGTADRLGSAGIAVISTDQVLAGPRDPGNPGGEDFFNFTNPLAARDNALQGVADAFSQLRLAKSLSIDIGSAAPIALDPSRLMFFGHSEGGLTGPGFVATEPTVKGAVLSGTGGLLYLSILYKSNPIDFRTVVGAIIDDANIDETTPELALLQTWLERADGANIAPLFVRAPFTGNAPRNIFQSEGFIDTYAPNPCIEAFATAVGGDIVETAAAAPVEGLTLRGRSMVAAPMMNNLDGATVVLAQYNMVPGSDGHFVVFEVPAAETQSAQFLGTLAATGTATVVPAQ
jgi:hypothetical protein